jgi:hypothetical protein
MVGLFLILRRNSLVRECHGPGAWLIERLQIVDLESGIGNQFINFAIEVAATGKNFPDRGQTILPGGYSHIRRASMLQENK